MQQCEPSKLMPTTNLNFRGNVHETVIYRAKKLLQIVEISKFRITEVILRNPANLKVWRLITNYREF